MKHLQETSHCIEKLLLKLKYYGIRNNTIDWLENFLNNRQQCVIVDGEYSAPVPVLSGVPQGSVIGPALFLTYINDLPNGIKSKIRSSLMILLCILPSTTAKYCQQLQHDLTLLQKWGDEWLMQFNASMCEVLRVSRAHTKIPYTYILNGTPLKETDHTKYLGIHISKDLKWNKHIDVTTAKANRSLGFLKRNLKISSRVLREKAYTGFVRPQIEYGAAIWDPRPGVENNGAHKTEMVQRRAARWTLKRYHNTLSVSSMLLDLGWRSLEQRRTDSRLTLLYNIHKGHVPIEASKHIQPMNADPAIPTATVLSPSRPVAHLTDCRSTRELLLNGTVFPSLFLITMTLLLLNIPSLLSVTILSTNYFSCLFIV